jgi:peptidoglycan/xylan/chitin deacetylase (PgdA/CDA1 family)
MKSVVYHKIKKFDKNYKFDKFLHIENFKKQIKYFKNKYNFIDCKRIFDKSENFQTKDLFLTFDDGLKMHYDFVYPQLKKNKINGIFYLSTLPFTKNKILTVHKIHILLSKIKNDLLLTYINKNLDKSMVDQNKIKKFRKSIYIKQKNLDENVKIKKILNYSIKTNFRSYFIGKMFKFFFPTLSESRFVKEYYLSEKNLNEMLDNNMILGTHTQNHEVLSSLSFKNAKQEVDLSLDYLEQFTDYKTFCYPYGSKESYNKEIVKHLNKKNVSFSVTVTNKNISKNDLINKRQELSRFDCNNFKYGEVYK